MRRLEYVASGCAFYRLNHSFTYKNPEVLARVKETFVQVKERSKHHNFSLLFNAYTEKAVGRILHKNYKDVIHNLHSDSGGLQIVTRGLPLTEEIKQEVYDHQGKYSDLAMSFDEIPISYAGESSGRLDIKNRWFDNSKFEDCALNSGKNLNGQIETFKRMGTETKTLFIVQGNDYESYMKWAELMLTQIPPENRKHIGGIALGGAALGDGALEDIRRAFYYTQLPWQPEPGHAHFLGIGAVRKILPALIFIRNGVYGDSIMSYDSTTHTSGIAFGAYIDKFGARLNITREVSREYYAIYDELKEKYPWYDYDFDTFSHSVNLSPTNYLKQFNNREHSVITSFLFITSMIENFINIVDEIVENPNKLPQNAEGLNYVESNYGLYQMLEKVRTLDDFKEWEKEAGVYMKTNAVANAPITSLEEFVL